MEIAALTQHRARTLVVLMVPSRAPLPRPLVDANVTLDGMVMPAMRSCLAKALAMAMVRRRVSWLMATAVVTAMRATMATPVVPRFLATSHAAATVLQLAPFHKMTVGAFAIQTMKAKIAR